MNGQIAVAVVDKIGKSWGLVFFFNIKINFQGKSGTNFVSSGFKELFSDIEAKKSDCVVVKELSRLGRNYLDSGYYIEKYFPEHRIRFIAVNDSLDSNDGENDFRPFKNIINE